MTKPTPEKAARPTLTPAIIAAMQPGVELSDPDYPGLRVRCTGSGAKTFFYRYRGADGGLRQIKLGEFGAMTLAGARKALSVKKQEREQGIDPQMEKRKTREEAKRAREATRLTTYTVGDMVQHYIDEELDQQKRGGESVRLLNRELLPKLGARPAAAVTRKELQDLVIRPTMARAPRVATMLLSRIRCAYAHAAEQGRLPDDHVSPTVGIKGAAQVRRKRAFSDSEIAMFLRWLPNSPFSLSVRHALQLSLLTASRSGEIVSARWRDIDLDRGTWVMQETKNEEPHTVMLSRQALEILRYRRELHPDFVFPSPKRKDRHIAQKAIGLAQYEARQARDDQPAADPLAVSWTTHDLRRSAATGLARLGCPRVVQDRILNHVDGSVSAIYDQHRYDDEAREYLQRWADHLDALLVPNVTALDARAA
ncbi:tyrosine-type recombinase/integrase [Caballeronia sp. LZ029]|uniref:tyrosine-type recombinase/integrase n=1 Tax=Caballeronia sp. LZ029 TaxID=3038564 RepID=UPI00285E10B3|nr:tyrosine-type recombinase/integrase [Caballeronia sp. LZ029]MDR5743285.1 tyrosine-type recombinase/integrase [Caballeronia sp. LZ029]